MYHQRINGSLMKKPLVSIVLFFCLCLSMQAADLKFNTQGKLKIVQFTDTHFNFDSPKSEVVLEMMNAVLDIEKPDVVIFTGDVVTKAPLASGWAKITAPLVARKIHWAVVLGNHDHEHDEAREAIFPLIKDIPYNITMPENGGVESHGNYVLPVLSQSGAKPAAWLYCLDSNTYSPLKGVGKYGWFQRSQIDWYRNISNINKDKNGSQVLPALAFFHIPLPEYEDAWQEDTLAIIGVKNEKVCSPDINTGMFAAMLEQGDVMGTFVGHDHVNDYVVNYYGIALAYGRFSGGGDTYGDLMNGARVIVLHENTRQFDTWIRLRNGDKIRFCQNGG